MITYDEGRWSISFAFQLQGSVIPRACALAIPCSVLSMFLHWIFSIYPEEVILQFSDDLSTSVFQGFTFVLGFLIVFRTQQAYARWWEGGTLLQQLRGEWFNAFSNLMAFGNPDPEYKEELDKLQHQLVRLFSLLYGSALEQVTSITDHKLELEFIEFGGLQENSLAQMSVTNDSCELVLQWIQRLIVQANSANVIRIAPPILARVYNQLGNGIVKLNNARKIKDFPIPFSLAQMMVVLLILHWLATAMVCATVLKSQALAGLASFIVVFCYWGVNYISVELENPYGDDPLDMPLFDMQRDLNRSLTSLLEPLAREPPTFDFNPDRDKELSIVKFGLDEHLKSLSNEKTAFDGLPPSNSCANLLKVDSCYDGRCDEGSAAHGYAHDSQYRDSAINDRAHSAPDRIMAVPARSSTPGRKPPFDRQSTETCTSGNCTSGNGQDPSYCDGVHSQSQRPDPRLRIDQSADEAKSETRNSNFLCGPEGDAPAPLPWVRDRGDPGLQQQATPEAGLAGAGRVADSGIARRSGEPVALELASRHGLTTPRSAVNSSPPRSARSASEDWLQQKSAAQSALQSAADISVLGRSLSPRTTERKGRIPQLAPR